MVTPTTKVLMAKSESERSFFSLSPSLLSLRSDACCFSAPHEAAAAAAAAAGSSRLMQHSGLHKTVDAHLGCLFVGICKADDREWRSRRK